MVIVTGGGAPINFYRRRRRELKLGAGGKFDQ